MLFPKKVKYRRFQRLRTNPKKVHNATRGTSLSFGTYGMKALAPARLRSNQIEASRRVISRTMEKNGRMWIRIFPDRPWTQKAAEVGMGKGKGDPQGFEAVIQPGSVIFELSGISEEIARRAIEKAGKKLPIKVKFIAR